MKKRIALQGSLFSTAAILCLIAPKIFFPDWESGIWEEVFDTAGFFIILIGLLIRISARGYKAENSQQSNALVTGKIYSFVRNPMYFASFLIGLGLSLSLFNIWIALLSLSIYLMIYIREMNKEKEFLLKHFGDVYVAYCKEIPMFFPKLSSIMNFRKYLVLKKEWIKKEYNTVAIVFSVLFLFELWQDSGFSSWSLALEEFFELSLIGFAFFLLTKAFMSGDHHNISN